MYTGACIYLLGKFFYYKGDEGTLTWQNGGPLGQPCLQSPAPDPDPDPCPCFPTSPEPSSSSPWRPGAVAAASHTAPSTPFSPTQKDCQSQSPPSDPQDPRSDRIWNKQHNQTGYSTMNSLHKQQKAFLGNNNRRKKKKGNFAKDYDQVLTSALATATATAAWLLRPGCQWKHDGATKAQQTWALCFRYNACFSSAVCGVSGCD